MRIKIALLLVMGLVMASPVSAGVITVASTNVNRLASGFSDGVSYGDINELNQYFSTFKYLGLEGFFLQSTLIYTDGSTFDSALTTAFGSGYKINSVQLIVGSDQDSYASDGAKGAYRVLTSYDPQTVTWNNFNAGGVAGTEYAATPLATGVINGNTTTWTFSAALIKGWISSPTSNKGLYFKDHDASEYLEAGYTGAANVVWSIDASPASPVPEPSSLVVLSAVMGLCGCVTHVRRARATGKTA